MTKDENKGITSISYNHLNLPVTITFVGTNKKIEYLYNANGVKVKQTIYNSKFLISNSHRSTAEGYYDVPTNTYIYNYTDHLGNVRLSYKKDSSTSSLLITNSDDYYPFGLKHNTAVPNNQPKYKYKYNGKELQDELGLNVYDYGARNYDASLGRWFNVDPLAENSRRWSPYNYVYNNPMRFIDPDGMQADDIFKLCTDGTLENVAPSARDVVYTENNFNGDNSLKEGAQGIDLGEKGTIQGIDNMPGGAQVAKFGDNQQAGLNYFKFAADNTNVEFTIISDKQGDNGRTFVGTTHNEGSVSLPEKALGIEAKNITLDGHSHPVENGSPRPSGLTLVNYNPITLSFENSKPNNDNGGFNDRTSVVAYDKNTSPVNTFVYNANSKGQTTIHYNSQKVISIQPGFNPNVIKK